MIIQYFNKIRIQKCLIFTISLKRFNSISTKNDLNNFLKFENNLNSINNSNNLDLKIKFLLNNYNKLNILDLNIPNEKLDLFYLKLINNYNLNFNDYNLKGIGSFLKLLVKNSINGINIVKNCGLISNNNNNNNRDEIYKFNYSLKLQLLTINLLIEYKYYNDAYHFIKIFNSIHPNLNNSNLTKFKFKLSKFKEFKNLQINSNQLIDSNLVHLYCNELIKSNNYLIDKKLEYFLLILFKYINLKNLKNEKLSLNEIKLFNSNFLLILKNQNSISYTIFLSYFIKLYPNSIDLLKKLCLINSNNSILKNKSPNLNNLLNVNIKNDLIQLNQQPFIFDLSLLYSKFLNEKLFDRSSTKQLFDLYIKNVKLFQSNNLINNNYNYHPFNEKFHDSSVLLSFLNYSFNSNKGLNKPKLSSNLIINFFKNLKISKINKLQIKEFELIINYFNNLNNFKFNSIILFNLINEFNKQNIFLNINIYFNLINSLIKLNFINEAKKIYLFLINNPFLSNLIEINHINSLCYKYSWPYPIHLLDKNLLNNSLLPNYYNYNKDYLINYLSPDDLIKNLDLKLEEETHRKVNDI